MFTLAEIRLLIQGLLTMRGEQGETAELAELLNRLYDQRDRLAAEY